MLAQEIKIEEPRLASVLIAQANPVVEVAVWPTPVKRAVFSGYDCVTTLKRAGILTCTDCSPTDNAINMPIYKPTLTEGECGVLITYEGNYRGHALYACMEGGQLISKVEGAHPVGPGRIVPPTVIKGVAVQ